jgi:hypothetical protein
MQLVELALYSNGAHFLRYSLLELLSLSLTASAISPHLVGLMCAVFCISMYRCNNKITFDAFVMRMFVRLHQTNDHAKNTRRAR